MRLAAKLILLFLGGLLLIVTAFAALTIQREKQLTLQHHQRYAREFAEMVEQLEDQNQIEPPAALGNESRIRIRRVELTATDHLHAPSVPHDRLYVSEEITTITMSDGSGNDRLYTYVPIHPDQPEQTGDSQQRYEVSAPDVESEDRIRRTLVTSLLTLLCVSGLSALVVYFGGIRMVGRPLDRLIDKVNEIAAGDLKRPVDVKTGDELGDLAGAINQMCECLIKQRHQLEAESQARIAAVEQLRHADRLRSVGRIAAGIAHEIGTPLNVVSGHAELIESGELSDDAIRTSCRQIKTETDRIAKIISNVLEFARGRTTFRKPTDVRTVVAETCDLLRPIARKSHASLDTELPDQPAWANIDAGQIQQVLTNLINNAIQSRETGATVRIAVDQTLSEAVTETRIAVSDNGAGISEQDREHLFEPFFTTKDVGQGTGLGLAIALGIVHEHGGDILVDSQPGEGSTFTVVLRDPNEATE
jgi:signal transduction histidine kinase